MWPRSWFCCRAVRTHNISGAPPRENKYVRSVFVFNSAYNLNLAKRAYSIHPNKATILSATAFKPIAAGWQHRLFACLKYAAAVDETYLVVDAVISPVVVGFGCPNAYTCSCCFRYCVSGNRGIVCMTGDTCHIQFTIRNDGRTG